MFRTTSLIKPGEELREDYDSTDSMINTFVSYGFLDGKADHWDSDVCGDIFAAELGRTKSPFLKMVAELAHRSCQTAAPGDSSTKEQLFASSKEEANNVNMAMSMVSGPIFLAPLAFGTHAL